MVFSTLEEAAKVADLLAESDFEKADCRWESSGSLFRLETARPDAGTLRGGGLFRKGKSDWIRCRLTIRHVQVVSLWEEYDVKPPLSRLIQVEPAEAGFIIRFSSTHGLRVELSVNRLDGVLEESEHFR